MKKLVLVALALQLGVSACKKEEVDLTVAPAPIVTDGATVVEGTYAMTQTVSANVVTKLPANGVSGQVTFTRTAANQSTMRLLVSSNGAPISDTTIPVFLYVTGTTIDLFADTGRSSKIGSATKNSVKLTATANGSTVTIDASR